MKKVTTYIESGRTFFICKDEHGYWGFEDKYIDDTGRLTKQFNGGNGHLSKTLKDTIQKVSWEIKVDALEASGMDRESAALKVIMGL